MAVFESQTVNRRLAALLANLLLMTCSAEGIDPGIPVAGLKDTARLAFREHEEESRHPRASAERESGLLPLPRTPRFHPRLPDMPAHGSISVGTSNDGYLVDGKELALVGAHHAMLAVQALRGTAFATDELVAAIEKAAAKVAFLFPDSILYVGNMSKGGGGDIPWSHSHNSGRDADLAFYVVDATGRQVQPLVLYHVGTNGVCLERTEAHFDDARNWQLVKALLSDETIAVQWLFIADFLKNRMLTYAHGQHEPESLLRRAQAVLHQPLGVPAHDDHIHLRIHCSPEDALEGCSETGIIRSWRPTTADAVSHRIERLRHMAANSWSDERSGALWILRLLNDRASANLFIRSLRDSDEGVRQAALQGVLALHIPNVGDPIRRAVRHENVATLRVAMIEAMATSNDSQTLQELNGMLSDTTQLLLPGLFWQRTEPVQRVASRVLVGRAVATSLAPLIAALESSDEETVAYALKALRYLTNQVCEPVDTAGTAECWRAWAGRHRRQEHEDWVAEGFRNAGIPMPARARWRIPQLLVAIDDSRSHISHNARRWLTELAGVGTDTLAWSARDAQRYWTRWCRRTLGSRHCRP